MEKFKKLFRVTSGHGKIYDFDGKVHVGNKGTIFVEEGTYNTKHMLGRIRSARKTQLGYLQVCLTDVNGKKAFHYIHRLVAFAWLKKKDYHTDVMHKDDDTLNNSVNNLCWGTHTDNMRDMLSKKRQVSKKTIYEPEILIDIYSRRRKGEKVKDIHKDYPYIANSTFSHYCSGRALRLRGLI